MQADPTPTHAEPSPVQVPFVHTLLQQSAPVVHVPLSAVQGVSQSPPLQIPWQQSLSTVHVAPCAAHEALPASQRWVCLSQTIEQQPLCGPELQFSPIPRQVVFAMSSWHIRPFPVSMQMFEQQSPFAVHGVLSSPHSAPPHVPPLQFKLQQSVAFAQVWPSATHSGMHWVTPVWPCTGSQRPLQHVFVGPSTHA